jgi:hypothetical protein
VCAATLADGQTTFVVNLALKRASLGDTWKVLVRNPMMPLQAVLWIHYEAFRVWFKGVAYVAPPEANSRPLGMADLLKHLLVFSVVGVARYGVFVWVVVMMWRRFLRLFRARVQMK